jgi:hypothetical protein
MCSQIRWSDGRGFGWELIGGFPNQLFYWEFSTIDDYAPFANLARYKALGCANNRIAG